MRILKKVLPHIVALVVFAAVSAAMFYPQYQDKALRQGDVVNHEGTEQDLRQHIAQYGEHPYWLGRMFGGMPSYTLSLESGFKPTAYWRYFDFLGQPASLIFFAMAGFYVMLLLFGVNAWLAIVGGLAYGLSTYFPIIIGAGHITKMWALMWVAPLIGSVWYAYRRHMWGGAAAAALFASLEIGAGHPQITFYFLFVILALVVNECFVAYKDKLVKRFYKTTAVLALAAVLAVGSNIISLYYLADYAKISTRGAQNELSQSAAQAPASATAKDEGGLDREYITAWSYGKAETFNLFIPNFMGGGRDFKQGGEVDQVLKNYKVPADYYRNFSSYHGVQPFTEGPVYIGAVVVFLSIFAMFFLRSRAKWWILAPVILAIMLAWGKHFMWFTDLFINYFPLYDKFRVVSMILVVVEWALPALAVLGMYKVWKDEQDAVLDKKRVNRALLYSLGISGGVALISAIILPSAMSFVAPSDAQMSLPEDIMGAMQAERASLLAADAWRSLLFVVLAAGALWLFIGRKVKGVVFAAIVAALVFADLWGVDRRYIRPEEFVPKKEAMAIEMTDADRSILLDTTNFRVADFASGNPFSSSRASYFHRSVGGYNAAKVRRYQDVIDAHLSQMNMAVYDMLNTKYIITEEGAMLNANAAGNAWVADSVKWVATPTEELAALSVNEGFDPRRVVVVEKRWQNLLSDVDLDATPDSTDRVQMTEYRVNRQTYHTNLNAERLVVFSENYHKDWSVTVDGEMAAPISVDYILRAVVVPAGSHNVVWQFTPPHRAMLGAVNAVSTWLIILSLLGCIALSIYKSVRRNGQQ